MTPMQTYILSKTIQYLTYVPGGALLCMTDAEYISHPYLTIIKWVSFILRPQRGLPVPFGTGNNISEMHSIPGTMDWICHVLLA